MYRATTFDLAVTTGDIFVVPHGLNAIPDDVLIRVVDPGTFAAPLNLQGLPEVVHMGSTALNTALRVRNCLNGQTVRVRVTWKRWHSINMENRNAAAIAATPIVALGAANATLIGTQLVFDTGLPATVSGVPLGNERVLTEYAATNTAPAPASEIVYAVASTAIGVGGNVDLTLHGAHRVIDAWFVKTDAGGAGKAETVQIFQGAVPVTDAFALAAAALNSITRALTIDTAVDDFANTAVLRTTFFANAGTGDTRGVMYIRCLRT